MRQRKDKPLPVIGWREWVKLPDLDITNIKAKIDTGARSSSLHAFDMKIIDRDGQTYVRFKVHPLQRSTRETIQAEVPVLEFRSVRSSSGQVGRRPVIVTPVEVLGQIWPIELTLANRDAMGFRMLLGREAVRRRFLVDSGRSYINGIIKPNRDRSTPKSNTVRLKQKKKSSSDS